MHVAYVRGSVLLRHACWR